MDSSDPRKHEPDWESWRGVPVSVPDTRPRVTISRLSPDQKRAVWAKIKRNNAPLVALLKSLSEPPMAAFIERTGASVSVVAADIEGE